MGLTVHYELSSRVKSTDRARQLVERVRQLALDLPFESVGEVEVLDDPAVLTAPREALRDRPDFWAISHAIRRVTLPWSRLEHVHKGEDGLGRSRTARQREHEVRPTAIVGFTTIPSDGCESADFGLALYPAEVRVEYDPRQDRRYQRKYVGTDGRVEWHLDWRKFCRRYGHGLSPTEGCEPRTIRTGCGGWRSRSFCKTQYASDPACGGLPNFLRGHIALVTLLDRAAAIPGLTVEYDDEGKYGPSNYTDDWTVPEPVYYVHPGKYSVKALAEEVGSWNGMIAGMVGVFKDLYGAEGMEAPIAAFADFERLEFKGSTDPAVGPFLEVMRKVGRPGVVDI